MASAFAAEPTERRTSTCLWQANVTLDAEGVLSEHLFL